MMSMKELFRVDTMSTFVGLFVALFSILTMLYSTEFMRGRRNLGWYYLEIVLTLAASLGAVFANNLVLFMVFWGILGLLLYLLIMFGDPEQSPYAAKKTFIIIGGTDTLMLLGLAIVWRLAGSPPFTHLRMDTVHLALNGKAAMVAYLCLAAGALAKAGAFPFHTWVPDTAQHGPTPVAAYLPASLDKLLGIYLFARLTMDLFVMTPGMSTFMMVVGSVTIIAAVMMALIQHDLKRLLGYHAVSQVGYMVLGIGTGTGIGIAGGLFHMLNHAIYKSCLFFSAGAVEKRSSTCDLEKLGGYAKMMPITFVTFLMASLAISGVPPFNGFVSKWMIYQGMIEGSRQGNPHYLLWLIAAMFGSALTLASFMKLVHAVFLGQTSPAGKEKATSLEVGPAMWIPTVVLAGLCLLFGIFAYSIPLKLWIQPSVEMRMRVAFFGDWHPVMAVGLLGLALLVGAILCRMGTAFKTRTAEPFVGGEVLDAHPNMAMSGVDFYRTVQDISFLRGMYCWAERKAFDVYEVGTKFTFGVSKGLGLLHNGVLPRYLAWCLLGTLVLFWVLTG